MQDRSGARRHGCKTNDSGYPMCFRTVRFLLCVVLFLLLPGISLGHSPHHIITDVAVSSANTSEGHVFILITDQIFKSDVEGVAWKNLVNGLNNQYSFTSIGISPDYESDKTLFVASAGDGVYRSTDSGDSWHSVNTGIDSLDISKLSISVNYKNDRRLLAAAESGGVWRSDDGGNSWRMVLTETVQVADFAELYGTKSQTAVIAGDTRGRVWRSDDNGWLWEIIYELPDAIAISSVAGKADELFVGTQEYGLYHSNDSGRTFARVKQFRSLRRKDCQGIDLEPPISDPYITSVTLSPEYLEGSRIFVTTWYDGVFVSDDKGETWSSWSEGLSCDQQADDIKESHFRDVAITSPKNGYGTFWLGAFDGLFRSVGEDSHWQQLETLPLGLIKGMAVTGGRQKPLAIAIATYGGGFYLTEDRGLTWTIGNKGLLTTRLTDLAFSSNYSEDGVIYGGASRRLLRSSDRGQSWQRINLQEAGLGTRILNKLNSWGMSTNWIRSSDSPGSSQVYPTHIVTLPESGKDRALFATRSHGVKAYDNSSQSVVSVWTGTDRIINSLEISPDFERDQTLFASIRSEGVIRSEDGGISWMNVSSGLKFVSGWADNPGGSNFRRDVSVAISPGFSKDRTVFAGSSAGDGLYVSDDRGDSWTRLQSKTEQLPAPVLAIALSPNFGFDNTMMVSIKGQGILRSVDRGLSFDPVGYRLKTANASIEFLAFSPNFVNDRSIIAASDEQLFISEDRGESWSEILRPVRYEDMRDVVLFAGDWEQRHGENYSAMTESIASKVESSVRMRFVGAGIRWLGSRGPEYGSARVYLDDELVETVQCHASEPENMQELFVAQGLEFGAHTIEVRLKSERAEESEGIVSIDAFDVLPAGKTTH